MVIMFRTGWITRPSEGGQRALHCRDEVVPAKKGPNLLLDKDQHILPRLAGAASPCFGNLGPFSALGEGQGTPLSSPSTQPPSAARCLDGKGERCLRSRNKGSTGVWQRSSPPTSRA